LGLAGLRGGLRFDVLDLRFGLGRLFGGADVLVSLALGEVREPRPEDERRVDELEVDHLRSIARTRSETDDARVAARPLRIARAELVEELVHHVLRAEERHR